MMAKNNQRTISFGLWKTQTYDHHTLQSGSHSKPFKPFHELYNVEKHNLHHDDKVCPQQYRIAEIDNELFVDLNMKAQVKRFGCEDK